MILDVQKPAQKRLVADILLVAGILLVDFVAELIRLLQHWKEHTRGGRKTHISSLCGRLGIFFYCNTCIVAFFFSLLQRQLACCCNSNELLDKSGSSVFLFLSLSLIVLERPYHRKRYLPSPLSRLSTTCQKTWSAVSSSDSWDDAWHFCSPQRIELRRTGERKKKIGHEILLLTGS